MLRINRLAGMLMLCLTAVSVMAAEKGPRGGHLVDTPKHHLELVVDGQVLRLHVADLKDRAVDVKGASARATVISGGGKGLVELKPAGEGTLEGKGAFGRTPTMKVDVVLTLPGEPAPIAAKFTPLAATGGGHDHKGHKH